MPPPDHPDVEHEERPGKQKQNEEPEIAYEENIPAGGEDPDGQAEIRPVPGRDCGEFDAGLKRESVRADGASAKERLNDRAEFDLG